MQGKRPLPETPAGWLAEIADAFADARETIPFAELLGDSCGEVDLFHLAPDVTLKFRGLARAKRDAAVDAAFASYTASEERGEILLDDPVMAFGFCYLASHFGLGLVGEPLVNEVMAYLEEHRVALRNLVDGARDA